MKLLAHTATLFAAASFLALAGCTQMDAHSGSTAINPWANISEAVAVIKPTAGNKCEGVVHFVTEAGGVHVKGSISNLEPNSEHAFHIHELGDISGADGMSTGGHYNPEGHKHGGPHDAMHHAGDFGNVKADAGGVAHIDFVVSDISVSGDKNPIVGRGLILHAKADDLKTQPTGNAGGRIGAGVIGVAKPAAK